MDFYDTLKLNEKIIETSKVSFGRSIANNKSLDIFSSNYEEWKRLTFKDKPDGNIFSLVEYYHKPKIWIFGGLYTKKNKKITLRKELEPLIGKLKLRIDKNQALRFYDFKEIIPYFEIYEIAKEKITDVAFSGYENINQNFNAMSRIINNKYKDWKGALTNVKGIYLITDKNTGKFYVGSAYGSDGVWGRWSNYIENGHGGNKELKFLIKRKSIDYARNNFNFVLLEHRPINIDSKIILDREIYWKNALLTRGKFGYNSN